MAMAVAPHIKRDDQGVAVFCDNLRAYLDGRPLANVIELARGY